ncbi:MAG: nickel transporter permease [Methanomethylovorans sp.]|uniref:nickel transporter permease n=1 Tax=Methanomethylovorans sp. TaxID=2758717 RepID=UPI000A8EECDF|nr:nickel transporter permease [Methanomethylovorans sp.]
MSKHLTVIITTALAASIVLISLIAPFIAPNDPYKTDFKSVLAEPNDEYPLGTDQVGRCILSRILYGANVSLSITFALLSLVFVSGVTIGIVSGMKGGIVDDILMRLADIVLAFPDIVLVIAIVGVMGSSVSNMIIGLSLVWWTKYARLTRVSVMKAKGNIYVSAARMAGASDLKLITHYILPNIATALIVQLVLDISGMLLAISSMSFLGLGVQPPTPEWGNMLNEGRSYFQTAPWLLTYPGLAIFITVAVFNLLGDGVREILSREQA